MKLHFPITFLIEGTDLNNQFTSRVLRNNDIFVEIDDELLIVEGDESDLDEYTPYFLNIPEGEEYYDYQVQ